MTTALLEKKLTEDAKKHAEEEEFFGPALMGNLVNDMWRFADEMDPFFGGLGLRRRPILRNILRTPVVAARWTPTIDRKSTRLNSSHLGISYAVFCLKKKKN